jgi:catechol 2,3-dioxygenase-like lactoylglutathione lyase family enzyme
MRLNAGIITDKMEETKKFYTEKLGFLIIWEADWFLLLSTPNREDTISFLASNHPTQSLENFRKPFTGGGVFLTIELEDVDSYYKQIKSKGIDIALDIRSEEWGDRHFAMIDPNNIGIDFVTHTKTE